MIPRIYKFDSGALAYVKVSRLKLGGLIFAFSIIGLAAGYAISAFAKYEESAPEYEELIVLINEYENENVSPEAIYQFMKAVGVKYPEIVWSQVALETGFKSDIFTENYNLFGMKRACCRPNVQEGESRGHATYKNWKMSIIDYAMWQVSTGVWKLKSESAYMNYLHGRYAEDPQYVHKVSAIRSNFKANLEKANKKFTGVQSSQL